MEPTKQQIEMCEAITAIISGWGSSNDIGSPSHNNYVENVLENLEFTSDDDPILEKVSESIGNLRMVIYNLNTNPKRHELR